MERNGRISWTGLTRLHESARKLWVATIDNAPDETITGLIEEMENAIQLVRRELQ